MESPLLFVEKMAEIGRKPAPGFIPHLLFFISSLVRETNFKFHNVKYLYITPSPTIPEDHIKRHVMTSTLNHHHEQAAEPHQDGNSPSAVPRRRTKEAAVAKTALKLSKTLFKACGDMNAYLHACRDAEMPLKAADDGRLLLQKGMSEFASHLDSVHNKGGAA